MNKRKNQFLLLAIPLVTLCALPLHAQDSPDKKIHALLGPATGRLSSVAEVEVPTGYVFLNGDQTRTMIEASGEPISGDEVGFLRPTNGEWAVYFDYDASGYVKDDDKDKLDAAKLLKAIKAGTEEGNKERKRNGNPPLIIVGWEQEPKYDSVTHNLTWAIRMTSEGKPILNYNTRLLGRKGVMEVVLVCDPEELKATLPTFNGLLTNYKFSTGESYAEYKPGDKVAKYGLGALVLGGAAVGAAKLGLLAWVGVLFKKAGKFVIIAFVAVAAFIKKIFNKITGNRPED